MDSSPMSRPAFAPLFAHRHRPLAPPSKEGAKGRKIDANIGCLFREATDRG